MSRAWLAFDVETAGLHPSDGFLVEVGVAAFLDGAPAWSGSVLVLPSVPNWWRRKAWARSAYVHQIPRRDIERYGLPEAKAAAKVHAWIDAWCRDTGEVPEVVAHHADFERRWLTDDPWGLVFDACTMREAEARGLPKGLGDLAEALGVEWEGPAHRAEPDARATLRCRAAYLARDAEGLPLVAAEEDEDGEDARSAAAPAADDGSGAGEPREHPDGDRSPGAGDPRLHRDVHAVGAGGAGADEVGGGGEPADDDPAAPGSGGVDLALLQAEAALDEAGTSRGDAEDHLPAATFRALRALQRRVPHADLRVQATWEAYHAADRPRFRRRPASPRAVDRLWQGERITPVGPLEVGLGGSPGHLFRREGGELVALTADEVVRLEVLS